MKKRENVETSQKHFDEAMRRFRKASSEHKELVRSLVPPKDREEDTGKFSVPPPPPWNEHA